MGAACCKKDYSASPKLPVCEAIRRYARQMCPLDPPTQKTTPRSRKFGLSDIVGPVVKKDSWAQTDPLPPPRRRKKKEKRRRSRSVEFLPYRLDMESRRGSGSVGDITGQEDAIDFQMFFMSRLPENSHPTYDEGKESISGRKKEFLSGLLGEQNNNLPVLGNIQPLAAEASVQSNSKQETSPRTVEEATSRRSSITESLKEFESSLLDMLQDVAEDEEDPRGGIKSEVHKFLAPLKIQEVTPTTLKEDDYILTPLEEEGEENIWNVNNFWTNSDKNHKNKDRCKVSHFNENEKECESGMWSCDKKNNHEDRINEDKSLFEEKRTDKLTKHEPPSITIETVS